MNFQNSKTIAYLSILLTIFLAVASFFGVFVPETYSRDNLSIAVQGIGQDIFDLFIVVPFLIILLILVLRNNKKAAFIFGGTVFYILYSYFIYSFGVHFNYMFVFYCFTLGSSFYLFVLLITELYRFDIKIWFENRLPLKSIASLLIIIALMFYGLWFSDILPAIFNNSVPESVSNYSLLTNPVHVMDISFMLPGLIITSVLLIKRKKTGFILAPILLVFTIMLSLSLISMAVLLKVRNVSEDLSLVWIFGVLAVISCIFLFLFLRRIKQFESN